MTSISSSLNHLALVRYRELRSAANPEDRGSAAENAPAESCGGMAEKFSDFAESPSLTQTQDDLLARRLEAYSENHHDKIMKENAIKMLSAETKMYQTMKMSAQNSINKAIYAYENTTDHSLKSLMERSINHLTDSIEDYDNRLSELAQAWTRL